MRPANIAADTQSPYDGIPSAVIYLTTAFCIENYCETIAGLEPPRHPPSAVYVIFWYLAIAGAIMFGIAFAVSITSQRVGVFWAFGACLMSWPHFGPVLVTFPPRQLQTLLPFPRFEDLWPGIICALVMLLVSTVYTLMMLLAVCRATRSASH